MEISKRALIIMIVVCFVVGMFGYRLVLSGLGYRFGKPASTSGEPGPGVPPTELVVNPTGTTSEETAISDTIPTEELTSEVFVPEVVPTIISPAKIDLTESDVQRLTTATSFKLNFISGNSIFSADDVIFAGRARTDASNIVVLKPLQYKVLVKAIESSDEPEIKILQDFAREMNKIKSDMIRTTVYFESDVIPNLLPTDKDVEEFYQEFSTFYTSFDSRYVGLNEHLKEGIKLYLLRENLVRYMMAVYQELVLTNRLTLNWPGVEPPWIVENKQAFSGNTEISPHNLKATTPLFTLDGATVPAGFVNKSFFTLNLKLLEERKTDKLTDNLFRIQPPETGNKTSLTAWLKNFEPNSSEAVVNILFATLARTRMNDKMNKETAAKIDPVLDTYQGKIPLSTLMALAAYTTDQAVEKSHILAKALIQQAPTVISEFTHSGFLRPLISLDLAWNNLEMLRGNRFLRINAENIFKYLHVPDDPVERLLFTHQELLNHRMNTILYDQFAEESLGSTTIDSLHSLLELRFLQRYPTYSIVQASNTSNLNQKYSISMTPSPDNFPEIPEPPAENIQTNVSRLQPQENIQIPDPESNEADLQEMYDKNADLFKIGEQYRFQILLHPKRSTIDQAQTALKEGTSFEQSLFSYGAVYPELLAKQVCPSESLNQDIVEALKTLQPGEVSAIFSITGRVTCYAIVKLLETIEPGEIPFTHPKTQELLQRYSLTDAMDTDMKKSNLPSLIEEGAFSPIYKRWIGRYDSTAIKEMAEKATLIYK